MSWAIWLAGVAVDEPGEGRGKVGVGIDHVELAGLDQRGDNAPVDAALIGAGEEGVLAGECDRTDRALDRVGIDLDPPVVEEDAETRPQLERVAHGLGDAGAARDLGPGQLLNGVLGTATRRIETAREPVGRT